jgi:hypothetical protein
MCLLGACFCVLLLALLTLSSARRQPFGIHSLFPYNIFTDLERIDITVLGEKYQFCILDIKIVGYVYDAKERYLEYAKVEKI